MIKISVIIPVYNTEEFLDEAISSILNQTLKEIEIVTINDGSTDGSLYILDKYAAEDTRVKIISQKNSGQASARNKGVDIAQGKYIYFMDSDDILSLDTLEICYEKCEKEGLDLVIFDADVLGDTNHIFGKNYYDRRGIMSSKSFGIENGVDFMYDLLKLNIFRVSPWLYLTRRSYIDQIGLRMKSEAITHEDELYTTLLNLQAKRIAYIPQIFFKRRVRANSIITRKMTYEKNVQIYFTTIDELIEFGKGRDQKTIQTIGLYITKTLNGLARKCYILPIKDRFKVFFKIIMLHTKHVSIKSLFILLFKEYLRGLVCKRQKNS